jgi:hypothetical protein
MVFDSVAYGNSTFVVVGIDTILQSDPLFTNDLTPPVYVSGYPKAGTVNASSAEIKVKADENGNAYFVSLPLGAAAPSSEQVKAGQNAAGTSVAANMKGSMAITASVESSFSATGLTGNTDYDVYVVAEDSVHNLQTLPGKITVKTATAVIIPILPGFDVWDTKTANDKQKTWTVKFNLPVDTSSLSSNIYITDANNVKISTNISTSADLKSIDITPVAKYTKAVEYRLYITKDIFSSNSKKLNNAIAMPFIVQ